MSQSFLLADLLLLVIGLPLIWTLRDLGGATLMATAGGPGPLPVRGDGGMPAAAPRPTEEEKRLMRAILHSWHELCPGDVATIDAVLGAPGSHVATITGSPSNLFWSAAAELRWARRVSLPAPLRASGIPTEIFTLTGEGVRLLPDFRRRYDLVFGTSYARAA